MSLNFQPSGEKASQLLNFNMENISHELSSLLIGGELDGVGAIGSLPTTMSDMSRAVAAYGDFGVIQLNNDISNSNTSSSLAATAPNLGVTPSLGAKEAEMLQLYRQYYYQQQVQHQQLLQQQQKMLQARQINTIPTSFAGGPTPSAIAAAHLKSAMAHGLSVNMNNNFASVAPLAEQVQYDTRSNTCVGTGGVPTQLSSSPKFEFHFLRCQSTSKMLSDNNNVPLISSAARYECETEHFFGSGRRGNRDIGNNACGSGQRRFSKHADVTKEEEIDYDKIVVDLSVLGLSLDNKEHNPVLRLFGLFRKTHYYLNEGLPGDGAAEESDIIADNHHANTLAKCSMPCTMNVQYQVRQAARKCTIFLCNMQRILNSNKMHSIELYMECEQSLNMLRKLLTQFEAFKRVEMEHKRGQFVTEEARVHTQKLEHLLAQLSDQIRESHIYVHAFNWAVERSKRSMECNVLKEQQAVASSANEWVANAETAVDSALTSAIESKDDDSNSGVVGQSLSYDGTYGCGVGVVTVVDCEADTDRQSTRYIGYK